MLRLVARLTDYLRYLVQPLFICTYLEQTGRAKILYGVAPSTAQGAKQLGPHECGDVVRLTANEPRCLL